MFEGSTINTPSLLATEDYIDALKWGESIGGLEALHARANANTKVLADWVGADAVGRFPRAPIRRRARTPACALKSSIRASPALPMTAQAEFAKKLASLLEKEGVALDAASYRSAPPGLRIWCGATVEASDLEALTPWLDWAFATCIAELAKAA